MTSSPRYPKSNGLAERTVQTIKRIFTKSKADGHDIDLAILTYRTTPLDIGLSPSQLLMSRRLRSNIPTIKENLKPIHHDTDKVRAELLLGHDKSRSYHDRSAHVLKPLNSGDSVRVQLHDKKWSSATVLKPLGNRSYTVKTPTGCMYRRNRKFIHKTNEVSRPENLELPQYNIVESRSIEQSPDVMPYLSSNNVHPSESPKISSPQVPKTSNPYVTRSGRIVKPKVILST